MLVVLSFDAVTEKEQKTDFSVFAMLFNNHSQSPIGWFQADWCTDATYKKTPIILIIF